jgi:putative ABC transport system permease protein
MIRLALRNLLQERGRLLISLGGVAAAFVLVLVLEGVFTGAANGIVVYQEKTDADVWVMQEGVSNMHMATSVLPASLEGQIAAVPGVVGVTPILYVSALVGTGDRRWFSYVVGIRPDAERGGVWLMDQGRAKPGTGDAVIPDIVARKSGLKLGDSVNILGRQFRVAGISKETFSMANSITLVSYGDLADLLSAQGAASYFLVKAQAGVTAQALAESVGSVVPGVHAMTRDAFIESDRERATEMGVNIIRVMTLIGFIIGVLVIGLTMYTATVSRAREYGVVKALGANSRRVIGVVALQALVVVALGFVAAVAVAFGVRPIAGAALPEVALLYSAGSIVRLALTAAGIAALASVLPAWRVSRIEPGAVFRE